MFYTRLKKSLRTLRVRLMLWNAVVVIFTAVATLIGVREGVRRAILHEMDQILIEDVYEIEYKLADQKTTTADVRRVSEGTPSRVTERLLADLNRKAKGHQQHGWFVELLDEQDVLLWSSEGAPQGLPMFPQLQNFSPVNHGNLRLVQNRETSQGFSPLIVRVGSTTEYLVQDLERIDRLVALAAGVVLLCAPLIGFGLATRAIQPLSQIIRTTARLRPSRMEERLTIRHTGDELDQLAGTINGFLNRIAVYLAQKRDMLANSAHELRSPIAAIRSSVEVALGSQRSKEEYEELLGDVMEECTSLEVLVNQLLMLAETEADHPQLHMERVDLTQLIQKAVEMFAGVAESKNLRLLPDLQPAIYMKGQVHHLRQVINNLLDNAIKFTLPGGTIRIALHCNENRCAVLTVEDSGIGISAEDLSHIFERFYRVDKSRSRNFRGTGLGLSICQAVVHAHGGDITATSIQGRGTTFTTTFPLFVDADTSAPLPTPAGSSLKS